MTQLFNVDHTTPGDIPNVKIIGTFLLDGYENLSTLEAGVLPELEDSSPLSDHCSSLNPLGSPPKPLQAYPSVLNIWILKPGEYAWSLAIHCTKSR